MTANRLANETSPYLLQHRDNPVDWMPWGKEAFDRARSEDRPVLLSIGYAACHWCHVMAHESFEDPETAVLMNAGFVCIKVDREERPDVDKIYMDALHALGEQGGWPLTMFLKPDAAPFWGGTYFPKESKFGRPSFAYVLQEIARIWRDERDKADANGRALANALKQSPVASAAELTVDTLTGAADALLAAVDGVHGGLAGAPKFPQTSIFEFLWRRHLATGRPDLGQAVIVTLTNLCQGGIYDHLGGGFSRYAVDHRWLVPHFEKMLYDNALLVSLLAHIYKVTREPLFRIRIEETVGWLLTEMRAGGAFAASYDADSEGEEGKYYVWSETELRSHLDPSVFDLFARVYDVTPDGNWEGHTILNRLRAKTLLTPSEENILSEARQLLRGRRALRSPPGFDDKVLADWNGLAISALVN
ncbi:MAG TPA: thioredoxin domain-containing protein, partial [Aestuariivirgaceae bacterium]|nr:thioredoxin domain-containing protein [Aestuariivirgaceae bacterium]